MKTDIDWCANDRYLFHSFSCKPMSHVHNPVLLWDCVEAGDRCPVAELLNPEAEELEDYEFGYCDYLA